MKQSIIALFTLILLAVSCKKDETRIVYTAPQAVASFTSTTTVKVLDSAAKSSVALGFNWSSVSYGINASITYTLQFDTAGGNFSTPSTIIAGTDTASAAVITNALNTIALARGIKGERTGKLDVRVKAEVLQNGSSALTSSIPAVYSEVISITVTPYSLPATYLYVLGDFQGWSLTNPPVIADTANSGKFEGFVYCPTSGGFKFLTELSWDKPYWGYNSSTTMEQGVSGNLYTSGAGLFRILADTKAKTWSATSISWSLVGDAVSSDWVTDIPMTYDATSKTLVANPVTITSSGGFKFRADKSWTLNYGLTNGSIVLNGGNFGVSQTGNYKVTLDLNDLANLKYSIEKL
ncbi:SusE outer membrane protein [Filimonas lacunae]|uniref:SusE outer membrane protein n=1 Tax=Filimonas lacunae TaxID=477680 RepID=A0A173MN20_9BACT|nr:SusE domain-containing protein [Filimonas lacunae]BAV09034.1 hypothetical protein FLA_5081 [Filimonas lacunae]SIS66152.1 SusE outer membrane protein [Filimonas lacunae]